MSKTFGPAGYGRLVAGAGALAVGLGAALVAAPAAQAAAPRDVVADSGSASWGFRESFRRYVGLQTAALPPVGAVPVGERITLVDPATFDVDGTPAATVDTTPPNETLPYLLPVTGGSVTDADDLAVTTSGGAVFHFPSHAFTVTVENVGIEVAGGVGKVVGDLSVEIPENNLGYEQGTYGGDDVVLGDVATTTVDVSGDQVSVTADGVTLTAAGASALQDFLQAGAELDDLTVTADLAAPAQTWNPSVSLSKSAGFDPAATGTLTVTGSGFDPAANTATRPPITTGQPTGVYVVFGKFAQDWRPSDGVASSARKVVSQKWALPEPSYSQLKASNPSVAEQLVLLKEDGTFSADLDVKTDDSVDGVYGVYTYAAGGAAANAAQELAVPVAFTPAGGDGENVDVEVTVPESDGGGPVEPEPGEFTWTVASGGAVNLGTATQGDAAFTATGDLRRVTVTDTRAGSPAWSVTGTVTDFFAGSRSFSGSALGWTPALGANTGGAVAGTAVVAGSGSGLKGGATLVSAPEGHAAGSVAVDAGLDLSIPLSTPAGDYTGVLTLTAVG
ncbi:HtaA domain-containing protein [Isoptericola sp. NPDC056605]|uniref:HtaA domain-containing protein n=1 Tax=Isoptericola sp. NPDC056605 TaxID=3345876 RepID=UPI0036A209BE